MYIYIKIGKRVFTFGNDRKGVERRSEDAPVEDGHRESRERRREEPPSGHDAGDIEVKGDV